MLVLCRDALCRGPGKHGQLDSLPFRSPLWGRSLLLTIIVVIIVVVLLLIEIFIVIIVVLCLPLTYASSYTACDSEKSILSIKAPRVFMNFEKCER